MALSSSFCRMLRHFCLLTALALSACADNPYRASNRQETKGDGLSVVITGSRSEAEARPLAEDYCHVRGAAAQFVQYRTRRETLKGASFQCLPETIQERKQQLALAREPV
jgi:hypothetical protein